MRRWIGVAFAILVLLTAFTAWSTRPIHGTPRTTHAFEQGETWVYDVHESWTGIEPGSAAWPATLRVRATDIETTTVRAALVEYQGAWTGALLGPHYQGDGARAKGFHLMDAPGWRIIGRGVLMSEGDGHPWFRPGGSDPCAGRTITAEFAEPYPAIAPTNVLREERLNGTWKAFPGTYEFVTEFVGRGFETWMEEDVEVTHLRTTLQNMEGSIRTEIDIWYAADLQAILHATRWTHRAVDGAAPVDIYAQLELRDHIERSDVPDLNLASRDTPIPYVPNIAVGLPGEPLNLTKPDRTQSFWLIQLPSRTRWQPDPDTTGIEWRVIGPNHIANIRSEEAAPTLRFEEQGPHAVMATIYPKDCVLDQARTSLDAIEELARVTAAVPTYWEKSWRVDVPSGAPGDVTLDLLEFDRSPSRVVAFVERVGGATGPSTDGGRLVLRTPLNDDIEIPSEGLQPGSYTVVWRAQGAGGGAVVGDDWNITLQIQYFH